MTLNDTDGLLPEGYISNEDNELSPWETALKLWEFEKFNYGDTVPENWFHRAYNLFPPDRRIMAGYICDAFDLAMVKNHSRFRSELLNRHNMFLEKVPGGWSIVQPEAMTEMVLDWHRERSSRLAHKAKQVIVNTPLGLLSAEARKKNMEARVYMQNVKSMFKSHSRIFGFTD